MKRILPPNVFPKWALLGLVPFVLVLAAIIIRTAISFSSARDQLAYLSFVSGEVKVSDGIKDTAARNEALIARNARTLLKTGQGIASLEMRDGSHVIIDRDSTIDFNQQDEKDPNKFFAFSLVKGRAIIVNEKGSRTPTQIFIGGNITASVFRAAMGLEVTTDGEIRKRADCLVGVCLVNGSHLLLSGQSALIGKGGTVQVLQDVPYANWIALANTSKTSPGFTNLYASIFPMITPTTLPTTLTVQAEQESAITVISTLISSPIPTLTVEPTVKLMPSDIEMPLKPTSTWTTPTLRWIPSPTLIPTSTSRPARSTNIPIPSRTPTPGTILLPTLTWTSKPMATNTLQPTPSLQPTSAPTIVVEISPTPKPLPTSAPTTTVEPEPSQTSVPPPTSVPTNIIEPLPTNKPTKRPTNTPEPTATTKPTEPPIPTEPPPNPTEPPAPTNPPLPTEPPNSTEPPPALQ